LEGRGIDNGAQKMKQIISLNINGNSYDVIIRPQDLLVDVLRRQLGFIGTKKGCGYGDCGTCTLLV
jgi:carbon-monoxide dehydrogenase small subunit